MSHLSASTEEATTFITASVNASRGQYDSFANAPMNKLQLPLAALGAAPVPENKTQSRQLGIMDYLTAGLSGIAGMPRFM